jgi:type IV secretory pathway TrbD component
MEGPTKPSGRAKERLVDELRDAVGDDAVDRADLDIEAAIHDTGRTKTPETGRSRLLLVVVGVLVAAIIALALQSWVVFAALLALHAIGTAIVVTTALRTTANVEKPAPTTVAMLESEGISDPEGALNRLVDQAAKTDPDGRAGEIAEERGSITPSRDSSDSHE